MNTTLDKFILYLIHIINAAWSFRLINLTYHNGSGFNYFSDLTFLSLYCIAIGLLLLQWQRWGAISINKRFSSAREIRISIDEALVNMYGRFWYFIKPIPTGSVTDEYSKNRLSQGDLIGTKNSALINEALSINLIFFSHFLASFLLSYILLSGELARLVKPLENSWFLFSLVIIQTSGLLIYSFSTVIFYIFFPTQKLREA